MDVAAVRRLVAQQQEHGAGGAHGLNDSGTLSCGTGGDATTAGMPYSGGTPRRRSSASLALLGAEEEEEALRSVRVSADAVGGGGGEHDSISPMEPPVYHNGMPVTSWRDVYRLRFALEQRWMTPVDSSETADNDTTIDTPPFHPSIRVLTGHQESVYCLQFDSRHIVSGSRDDTIKVWDIATAQCLRTLHGHTQSVLCLQFESPPTPDGWLVSGGSDARILVWNMHTGQVVREMRGHEDAVLNVRFDRRFVVSASKDRTVRLWDFKTGAAVRQFIGHKAAVYVCVCQSEARMLRDLTRMTSLHSLGTPCVCAIIRWCPHPVTVPSR